MKPRVKAVKAGFQQQHILLLMTGFMLCLTGSLPVWGQATNQQIFQDIAWACMKAVPDTLQAFSLDAPSQMPYLRTALVAGWQEADRTVFVVDTTRSRPPRARLRYQIEGAQVAYGKAKNKQFERTVVLAVRYTLVAADGRILQEQPCSDIRTDMIDRDAVVVVESSAFPETQAEVPSQGWFRRVLEPAVLATVAVLGTYLFFSLRSNSDGGS